MIPHVAALLRPSGLRGPPDRSVERNNRKLNTRREGGRELVLTGASGTEVH